MPFKKNYQVSLFVILCISLNLFGIALSERVSPPLWLDAFGTTFCAYVCGPVSGAIVGATGYILYGIVDWTYFIYAITGIEVGLVVGFCARKKYFDTFFGTTYAAMIGTIISVFISTPFNLLLTDGMTENIWGDGVIGYLVEQGFPLWVSAGIGEFYLDFLDQVVTYVTLFLIIKFSRWFKKSWFNGNKINHRATVLLLFVLPAFLWLSKTEVLAKEGQVHRDKVFVQTIYSSDNGLPCGEANDVVAANDGILWVGTYAGLYRYNGSEFRWMNEFESVRSVNCLFLDEEGRLWIGTNDNGLAICINNKIVNVVDADSWLPSNSIQCITQSETGEYYVGTTSSMQILTLNGGLRPLRTIPEITYAKQIDVDSDGCVVTVTFGGDLFILNDGVILCSEKLSTPDEQYTCCAFDKEDKLYVGTSNDRIYVYDVVDGHLNKKKVLFSKNIKGLTHLECMEDGSICVCSSNGIGYYTEKDGFRDVNTGEFNNSVVNVTTDYQGNLWFASSRLGLLRMTESIFTDIYRNINLESKVVNSIAEWNGKLYFGTDTGLDIVSRDCTRYYVNDLSERLNGLRVRCTYTDSEGHLWICIYGKELWEIDENGEIKVYDGIGTFGTKVRVVRELQDGTIIAAGDAGMSYIKDHRIVKTMKYGDGLKNAVILNMLELEDGRLLLGTDGDGIALVENREVVRYYDKDNGLSSGVILRMVEDTVGRGVFIVTSNGLCYMDETSSIRMLNNFPYFNNFDVWLSGRDTLFVLGSGGIYVVDREDLLSGQENLGFELLDSKRGLKRALTANSWDYKDADDNLYLCCDSGVYMMNMQSYASERKSYRLMLSNVNLDGVSYQLEHDTPLSISRGTKKVELFPELINYSMEDPYVGYYLEGFDTEPTILLKSQLTSVVYTNIPAGNYTFHLTVLDNKKENVLVESSFALNKEKEIYDNEWFQLYMFMIAMLAVTCITWLLVRRISQRTLIIQQKELELARKQITMGNETILAIAKTVDAKDENTSLHSQRVSEYSVLIAKKLGFDPEELENLRKAALLHDIGKIGIPDKILNKPERLTEEEYEIMKSHVSRGAEILKEFTLVEHVVEGALYHHERYDGKGYIHGLKGEDIPVYGRIIGLADAFDAMTAHRVYRERLDADYVISELKKGKGTQFDPLMVDVLLNMIDSGEIDMNEIYRS